MQLPALDDALLDAVLGGKPATRVAGKPAQRRWPLALAMIFAVALVAVAGALTVRKLRVHPIAPLPPIARAMPATPSPEPSAVPPPVEIITEPIAISPSVVHHKVHARGLLSVNAIPWANLFVDGHAAGHTPRMKLPLDAGKHQLKLVTQAGESRARTVEIAANKETTLTVVSRSRGVSLAHGGGANCAKPSNASPSSAPRRRSSRKAP